MRSEARRVATALEEVVVTATRRELNLQDVAQSVTAFSTDDIEKQAFQGIEDVINALPSVNMVSALPGRNAIIMRGVSTGSREYRTDSQVSVYLDDQPMTSISQQVDMRPIDIERIESLPGPQGTLFGSSSQTGTMRYITNKPDPTASAPSSMSRSARPRAARRATTSAARSTFRSRDNIAVRAVGFYSHEGGYVDNVLGTTLMGRSDNADVVEEDWNDYSVVRRPRRRALADQPEVGIDAQPDRPGQRYTAPGRSDPALGDYKITRFFDEWLRRRLVRRRRSTSRVTSASPSCP